MDGAVELAGAFARGSYHPTHRIVALTGAARTGKNVAARLLRECLVTRHGVAPERVALVGFTDSLKAAVAAIWPQFEPEDDYSKLARIGPHGLTGRLALEGLGRAVRELDQYALVAELDAALSTDSDLAAADYVVVTDLRTPLEARWVRAKQGVVVSTTRPPAGPHGGSPGDVTHQPLYPELVDCSLPVEPTLEAWSDILQAKGWV